MFLQLQSFLQEHNLEKLFLSLFSFFHLLFLFVLQFREEPRVRVFSNTVHACGEAPPIQYTSRPDSFVLSPSEDVLFEFTDQTSHVISVFATTEEETQRWLAGLAEQESTSTFSNNA